MTHQSIYINHQGELFLIDAPEKPTINQKSEEGMFQWRRYEESLASAIKEGVKFKDKYHVCAVLNIPAEGLIGQTFPLPTGYKVSFEKKIFTDGGWQYVQYDIDFDNHQGLKRKLAILSKLEEEKTGVPKSRNRPAPPVVAPSEEVKLPITEKEKAHFWYHLGAAHGIVASISGKNTDFEKAWKESGPLE